MAKVNIIRIMMIFHVNNEKIIHYLKGIANVDIIRQF
jgi:hypothetical protein